MVETTLCYIFEQEKVLMLYRNKKENDFHEGKWNGLGGKIEKDESALDGIQREVFEESGLIIKSPKLLGVCYFPSFDTDEELMYLYQATEYEGTLIDCDEGDLFWINQTKLLDLNVWDSDRVFLPYVLENRLFIGTFQFEGKELVSHEIQETNELGLHQFAIEKGSKVLESAKKID